MCGNAAGRVGDHRGVLCVGLRLARVEIGDPAHGKSGQGGDLAAGVPGDREREGADRGGLVHDDQQVPNFAASLSKTARSLGSLSRMPGIALGWTAVGCRWSRNSALSKIV
jgi:hypothetical protein